MKKITILIILCAFGLLISNLGFAQETKTKSLEAVEFLTGFGWGKLHARQSYHLSPIAVAFDFSLKPLTQKFNFNPKQLLQFQVEPYISYISQPESNVELGTIFFFKVGILPQTSKFQPYIKAGMGMAYMTQHTNEQATQFNFTEQGAIGMHYSLTKNTSLTLEGRFRHLSNASIDHPNHGINTYFALGGVSYQF